nr:MAG TPA: hypothetical protein [Caudoviricetes sp.]
MALTQLHFLPYSFSFFDCLPYKRLNTLSLLYCRFLLCFILTYSQVV